MKSLSRNSQKNVIAIVFAILYIVMLFVDDYHTTTFYNTEIIYRFLTTFLVHIVTPALVLIYLLTVHKEYRFKKWLFPLACGIQLVKNGISAVSAFANLEKLLSMDTTPLYDLFIIICAFLACTAIVSTVCMFIGTLFDFRHIRLLRYGTLGVILTLVISLIVSYIPVYISDPSTYATSMKNINFILLITYVTHILFYVGIFAWTTPTKSKSENADETT